jgi:hypothetical protein
MERESEGPEGSSVVPGGLAPVRGQLLASCSTEEPKLGLQQS